VCPAFTRGLPRLLGICEGSGVDVDHDLVGRAGSTGIEVTVERGFGDEAEGVGLLPAQRGRIACGGRSPGRDVHPIAGGREGLRQHCADFSGANRPRTTTMPSSS
jgi:hypothetical protein